MRPRDILGVVIRAFGLWLIFQALSNGLLALIKIKLMAPQAVPFSENEAFAAFYLVMGLLLIVLADLIVQVVYGAAIEPALER